MMKTEWILQPVAWKRIHTKDNNKRQVALHHKCTVCSSEFDQDTVAFHPNHVTLPSVAERLIAIGSSFNEIEIASYMKSTHIDQKEKNLQS